MNNNKSPWYAFVPNLITSMNLMSGCVAVTFALDGNIKVAVVLMISAAVFDFFDGFVARLLKVSGELGKQLDSLADSISFGLLPGTIAFFMMKELIEVSQISGAVTCILLLVPLFIPVFSALRLAKFNIDTRQQSGFIGLPTPANALLWASLGWMYVSNASVINVSPVLLVVLLTVLIVVMSLLLTANIPMFALKFKNYTFSDNVVRYIFLVLSVVLIALFGMGGISICIVVYILMSLLFYKR